MEDMEDQVESWVFAMQLNGTDEWQRYWHLQKFVRWHVKLMVQDEKNMNDEVWVWCVIVTKLQFDGLTTMPSHSKDKKHQKQSMKPATGVKICNGSQLSFQRAADENCENINSMSFVSILVTANDWEKGHAVHVIFVRLDMPHGTMMPALTLHLGWQFDDAALWTDSKNCGCTMQGLNHLVMCNETGVDAQNCKNFQWKCLNFGAKWNCKWAKWATSQSHFCQTCLSLDSAWACDWNWSQGAVDWWWRQLHCIESRKNECKSIANWKIEEFIIWVTVCASFAKCWSWMLPWFHMCHHHSCCCIWCCCCLNFCPFSATHIAFHHWHQSESCAKWCNSEFFTKSVLQKFCLISFLWNMLHEWKVFFENANGTCSFPNSPYSEASFLYTNHTRAYYTI